MLAAPERNIKARHVKGNLPGLVGVIAKNPSSKPLDFLTLENRAKADALAEIQAIVEEGKRQDLRSTWETTTNKAIEKNAIKRRVNDILLQNKFSLEDRREKLKALLLSEQEAYIQEMDEKAETPLERQLKMRERAKELRQKREKERVELVNCLEDQRWRNNCEELRSILSKRANLSLNLEREKQLEARQEREKQNIIDDEFFMNMWKSELDKKAERETLEAKAKLERDKDMLTVLREQMAAHEKAKEDEEKIKQEEYDLLVQEGKLRVYEEEQERLHKLRTQEEIRNSYALSIRQRLRKQAKDEQEDLALDMKILESLLSETKNEAQEMALKKARLSAEYRRYREYLEQLKAEEARKEIELDAMLEAEQEKEMKKRRIKFCKEKEAREKLMKEVIEVRKQQIQERKIELEMEKAEAVKEKEKTLRLLAEQKAIDEAERLAGIARAKDFQGKLKGQIDFRNRLTALEHEEEYRQQLRQYEAESEYQVKLRNALEKPPDRLHPAWRQYYNLPAKANNAPC